MKAPTARTLIAASTYSVSANERAVKQFTRNSATMKMAEKIQVGTSGNQNFIAIPAARNSSPMKLAQLTQ